MRLRWRKSDLDEKVADAARQAELSRQRLAEARQKVIEPLKRAAEENSFAEILRASLVQGHRRRMQ